MLLKRDDEVGLDTWKFISCRDLNSEVMMIGLMQAASNNVDHVKVSRNRQAGEYGRLYWLI